MQGGGGKKETNFNFNRNVGEGERRKKSTTSLKPQEKLEKRTIERTARGKKFKKKYGRLGRGTPKLYYIIVLDTSLKHNPNDQNKARPGHAF